MCCSLALMQPLSRHRLMQPLSSQPPKQNGVLGAQLCLDRAAPCMSAHSVLLSHCVWAEGVQLELLRSVGPQRYTA